MTRRPGLGKGLDALIPASDSAVPSSGIDLLPVAQITPNPKQPRTIFNEAELIVEHDDPSRIKANNNHTLSAT